MAREGSAQQYTRKSVHEWGTRESQKAVLSCIEVPTKVTDEGLVQI